VGWVTRRNCFLQVNKFILVATLMGSSRLILVGLGNLRFLQVYPGWAGHPDGFHQVNEFILVGLATLTGSSRFILVGLATIMGSSRLILGGLGNQKKLVPPGKATIKYPQNNSIIYLNNGFRR
jgi:hypothetical protein